MKLLDRLLARTPWHFRMRHEALMRQHEGLADTEKMASGDLFAEEQQ